MNDEHNSATIEQLQRRREDSSRALWQAPVLTMTAQAFLLQVLSRESISQTARIAVLVAGLLSTLAALWFLLRARSREVLYSQAIASYSVRAGLPDIRPSKLKKYLPQQGKDLAQNTNRRRWRELDACLVRWAYEPRLPPAHLAWAVALMAFIVADMAIFVAG